MTTPPNSPTEDTADAQCPKCKAWVPDHDGFGVLAHIGPAYDSPCGYCSHPSRDDGVCGICGDRRDTAKERTVLEWTQGHNGVWHATTSMISAATWEAEHGGWCWAAGTLDSTFRSHIADSSPLSFDEARAAAESACRTLLCTALAAFAGPAPSGFRVTRWGLPQPGREFHILFRDTGDLEGCSIDADDAQRLALALLAASTPKEKP